MSDTRTYEPWHQVVVTFTPDPEIDHHDFDYGITHHADCGSDCPFEPVLNDGLEYDELDEHNVGMYRARVWFEQDENGIEWQLLAACSACGEQVPVDGRGFPVRHLGPAGFCKGGDWKAVPISVRTAAGVHNCPNCLGVDPESCMFSKGS